MGGMAIPRMRERETPCFLCGVIKIHGVLAPRTWTWNLSGRCTLHEDLPAQVASRAQEIHDR